MIPEHWTHSGGPTFTWTTLPHKAYAKLFLKNSRPAYKVNNFPTFRKLQLHITTNSRESGASAAASAKQVTQSKKHSTAYSLQKISHLAA